MTLRTSMIVALLALSACGGSNTQNAAATGDETTGARHESDNGATSGGELAHDDGACDVRAVFFGYDSSELDPSARTTLESNAQCLQRRDAGARVVGMTDPRGTEEYNLALGDRRAQTVTRYMANMGVDQTRLSTHSLGEETAQGEAESDWAQDRRAEIQVQ